MMILIVVDSVDMLAHVLTPHLLETQWARSRMRPLAARSSARCSGDRILGEEMFLRPVDYTGGGGVDYLCNELHLPNLNAMRPCFC